MAKSNAHIHLYGRIIADPENNVAQNNSSVTTFRVAVKTTEKVDQKSKDYDPKYPYRSDFYNVSAWGKLGDDVMKNAQKGSIVAVGGDLFIHPWVNRENVPQQSMNVQAAYVEVISGWRGANNQPQKNTKDEDNEPPF